MNPTHSHPDNRRINLPLQTRMASLEEAVGMDNGADRTFNVVFTTGATVRRYDYMNDEPYDEELQVDASAMRMDRLNSGAPVLDTHGQYSLDDVIGAVVPGSARVAKGVGRASIKIDGGEENAPVIRKIKDGIIKNVSVGYRVHRFEVIRGEGTVPLYRAVDWEPYEVSLVPIGADAGAGIRSAPHTYPCELFQPQSQPQRKETTMPDPVITKEANPPANAATASAAAAPAAAVETRAEPARPENPDPASKPANDPADDSAGEDATREGGVQAERSRAQEIQKIVRAAGLTDAYALRMINDGISLKKVRKSVLEELARANADGGEIRSHVTITRDEMDTRRASVENALLNRFSPDSFKLADSAREYRGMSLMEIGRDMLERRGVSTRGFSRVQLAGMMLGLDTRGGLLGTSDFPNILANIANKTLRAAYEAAPQTFKPFSRQTVNPDFKPIARTQLGDAPTLEMVNESGEFKRGSVSDAKEQYAL
ncbi:MAG: peptidase U35, partial [Pseudomonadota bacterium]|nr:peptidase U35 [Pseudomonadota bacterium]